MGREVRRRRIDRLQKFASYAVRVGEAHRDVASAADTGIERGADVEGRVID